MWYHDSIGTVEHFVNLGEPTNSLPNGNLGAFNLVSLTTVDGHVSKFRNPKNLSFGFLKLSYTFFQKEFLWCGHQILGEMLNIIFCKGRSLPMASCCFFPWNPFDSTWKFHRLIVKTTRKPTFTIRWPPRDQHYLQTSDETIPSLKLTAGNCWFQGVYL